MAYKYCHILHQ